MLRDAALEHLTRLGLTEDQITWEYVKSDTEADGTIIDQSIDAGSALTDGSRLTLTVAENPAPAQTLPVPDTGAGGSAPGEVIDLPTLTPSEDSCVTVADFVGRAFDAAKQELRAQGVYAVKCELRYHPTIPSGSVILQSPAGGARVRKGDAVYFVVSLGPEKQIVPSVLYQPAEEAKRILALHGCGWTTQDVVSSYVKTGHVAAQTPEGGSQTLPPVQVALEISAGKTSAVQTPGRGDDDAAGNEPSGRRNARSWRGAHRARRERRGQAGIPACLRSRLWTKMASSRPTRPARRR